MDGDDLLPTIAAAVTDRTARGIAAAINRLVAAGTLPPGARLPTVRALAAGLEVSPTTVSAAWQTLARVGTVTTRGRLGTFVLRAPLPGGPRRYRRLNSAPRQVPLDLSTGTPDPLLLPDLTAALVRVSRADLTTSYLDDPLLPALAEVLRARWPFPPEALTVVDGSMDALDRITTALVRFGDRVLVENPGFPPLLDLLERLGAECVGLPLDDDGIRPDALRSALALAPVALYLQPRAQNPTGISTTGRRAAELARLLRPTGVVVVEDEHAGDIAGAPPVSLGTHLPSATVHVHSFSKSHGPDLRLAAVGGAGDLVTEIANRRLLGPGWSSRLLQGVLVDLLADPASVAGVARARSVYADRRRALSVALAARGVPVGGRDGINVWVPVADERQALVGLAARGIGVAPGSPFTVRPLGTDHLRVTVGLVRTEADLATLADALAAAADGAAGAVGVAR